MIAKNKRKIHEINAGSMADIAFLLLIFFLVTTTMEIDQGLAKVLPLKRDLPIPYENYDRNVLDIKMNSNDELYVEGKIIQQQDLETEVRNFYTANKDQLTDPDMPHFKYLTATDCTNRIVLLEKQIEKSPDDIYLVDELSKWKTRLSICNKMPNQAFSEMDRMSVIQVQSQSKTSFKAYIHVLNTIKKVVNELRVEQCKEVWNKDYFALDANDEYEAKIISQLRIMIPERVIEKSIVR